MSSEQHQVTRTGDGKATSSRDKARLALWALLVVLVTVFAVLNTGSVEVDWVFGTFSTPLIVLIVVCLGLGLAIGLLSARLSERRRRRSAAR